MMRAAGSLPQVLQYIKEAYECDQCSIKRRPENRHRARCPRSFEFNRVLSVDVFYVKFGPYQVPILNMTDSGTCYQVLQQLDPDFGSDLEGILGHLEILWSSGGAGVRLRVRVQGILRARM